MSTRFYSLICLTILCAGFVYAAKVCQIVPASFPSVDANGNASPDNPGNGQGKICFNASNGKVVAKAIGQTTNESNAKQNFKNDPTVNEFYAGILISRSRFKVAANGACKLQIKASALGP